MTSRENAPAFFSRSFSFFLIFVGEVGGTAGREEGVEAGRKATRLEKDGDEKASVMSRSSHGRKAQHLFLGISKRKGSIAALMLLKGNGG